MILFQPQSQPLLQKDRYFEEGKQYTLGGISVTGLQKFQEGTVKILQD